MNVLNEFNFNNLNSNTENGDGSGIIILGLFFVTGIVFFLIVTAVFINKKRTPAPAPAPAPGGAPGETTRSPVGVQDLAVLPPDSDGTALGMFLSLLGPLLLGVGISAALDIVINRLKSLTAGSRTLIKNQLKALRSFKAATRPKFAIRAAARSAKKLLTQKLRSLGMVARVRLGMVWAGALKRAGYTSVQISEILARRIGQEATEQIMEKIAIRLAARAARGASLGPLAAVDLAFAAVTLGLDLANVGGWGNIDRRQTSDLLKERSINETEIRNSYIAGFKDDDGVVDPSTAVGFYPLYWGPLDEMGDTLTSDGLDVFDVMVEEKMFELLFADEPDPFIVKLLTNVAKKYGVSSTDIDQLISASMITDMTQDDYSNLYDRAFDSICISNGGVLVDTGVAGRAKQCSHATETACHAMSPWVEGEGLVGTDDQDITYTEWRDRKFFNKNYTPANVPAGVAGACIIQDPTRHEMCTSEKICRVRTNSTAIDECFNNVYIRNRGICHNKEDLCRGFGVSYCADMRRRGGSGGDCPTALDGTQADLGDYASILLPGETLPSCYKSTGDNWGEFFLGSTMYRYFSSGQYISNAVAAALAAPGELAAIGEGLSEGLSTAGQAVAVQAAGAQGGVLEEALAAPPPSNAESANAAEQFFVDFGNNFADAFNIPPPPPPPPPPGDCFPGSSLVTLEDSSVIQLRDLKLGMKVLSQCPKTGRKIFSEVFMWLVRNIGINYEYIKLTTDHGEILKLSSQHYVHVNDTLLSAQEVKIGDVVYIYDGKFEPTLITGIEYVVEDDAISPVTVSGNIVVNGVLASCVTTYEDLVGSSFPTIYFTKKTPPMMVHHWVFKNTFKYTGYRGVRLLKFLHRPLYILAGLEYVVPD
jgi:hypothetical protein